MDIDSFILVAADKEGNLYQVDLPSDQVNAMAKTLGAQQPDGKLPICAHRIEGMRAKANLNQEDENETNDC